MHLAEWSNNKTLKKQHDILKKIKILNLNKSRNKECAKLKKVHF